MGSSALLPKRQVNALWLERATILADTRAALPYLPPEDRALVLLSLDLAVNLVRTAIQGLAVPDRYGLRRAAAYHLLLIRDHVAATPVHISLR
jgi:hypothetical protein